MPMNLGSSRDVEERVQDGEGAAPSRPAARRRVEPVGGGGVLRALVAIPVAVVAAVAMAVAFAGSILVSVIRALLRGRG
jgi:hypothetical protein